jgi:hypothetical protein
MLLVNVLDSAVNKMAENASGKAVESSLKWCGARCMKGEFVQWKVMVNVQTSVCLTN